jgi:hypothetical protein
MISSAVRKIHLEFIDRGWMKTVDTSRPLPSIGDMFLSGAIMTFAIAALVLLGLNLTINGGGFVKNPVEFVGGCFLWLVAATLLALMIYGIASTVVLKRRTRKNHPVS